MSVFIYNRGLILCCTLALQLINIKVRHFAGNKYKYEYTRTFAFIKPWTGLDCRQPKLANLNLYNPVSLYFEFNDNVITLKCRIISMAVLFLFWATCKTQVSVCVCVWVWWKSSSFCAVETLKNWKVFTRKLPIQIYIPTLAKSLYKYFLVNFVACFLIIEKTGRFLWAVKVLALQ